MRTPINTNDAIASTVEGLMTNAYLLDEEAAATACSTTVERLAASRAQMLATARAMESQLDDGGTFNVGLWELATLREYVQRELIA